MSSQNCYSLYDTFADRYDEERDLGVDGATGIACFVCRKPLSKEKQMLL